MTVSLYKTSSDKRRINKNLTTIKTNIECIIKDINDIYNPSIVLENDNLSLDVCNYAFISEFNRYYYINDIKTLTGNRVALNLSVDVLMSFSSDILTIPVIIDKQEQISMADKYFNDGSFLATQREFVRIKEFANGFNDSGTYILIACGG